MKLTSREILYACRAAGHKCLVTVCPDCKDAYWRAYTAEQKRKP